MNILSTREQKLLEFLTDNDGWRWWSFRAIWQKLNIHHQTVANNIKHLVNKWYIREAEYDDSYIVLDEPTPGIVEIPVYWSAQCGIYWNAIVSERPVDKIPYSTKALWIANAEWYFFVNAKWTSMQPDVTPWDLLLIKQQSWWNESDKILYIYKWKPVIKYIRYINKVPYLISKNPDFAPVELRADWDDCFVGIVKKIIKNFD